MFTSIFEKNEFAVFLIQYSIHLYEYTYMQ